jgi:hypothetical protein
MENEQTLDMHLKEVKEQLSPLNVARCKFEDKASKFRTKASDVFATYMLRVYEDAKTQLEPILVQLSDLNVEYRNTREYSSERKEALKAYNETVEVKNAIVAPVFDVASRFPKEDRLVIAHAMSRQKFARFSCSGGFGYYKTPSDCTSCIEAEKNAVRIGIVPFYKSKGERVYQIDDEVLYRVLVGVISKIPDQGLASSLMEEEASIQNMKPDMDLIKRLNEQKGRLEIYVKEKDTAVEDAVGERMDKIREAMDPVKDLLRYR